VSSLGTLPGQAERSIKSVSWKAARQALMAMADFTEVTIVGAWKWDERGEWARER